MIRTAHIFALALVFVNCADQSRAPGQDYRANVGKTAFNAMNGVEIGRIEGVGVANGVTIYKVNRGSRIINFPVDHALVKDVPSTVAMDPAPLAATAKIDPTLEKTAAEFRTRLAYYAGTLLSITMSGGRFSAEWTSSKCDYLEGEVTDLVLSVERTMKTSPAIHGKRTCDGKESTFSVEAATFRRYRSGAIGDLEILKGIK